jgi:drug/metabolite transporter (DMT)-like permease
LTAAIAFSGPMTAFPLLMFAFAARRLPYTIMGLFQFASPTIVFLLGLLVFREALKPAQLGCFVVIWAAVALFVWDILRGTKGEALNPVAYASRQSSISPAWNGTTPAISWGTSAGSRTRVTVLSFSGSR